MDVDKVKWTGWMIFKRQGTQIGLVQSSFTLNKASAESTLSMRGREGEEVHKVTLVLED